MKDYQDIEQMFKNIDLPVVDVKPRILKKITTMDNGRENDFLNRTICFTISVILVFSMSLATSKIYSTFFKDKPTSITNSFRSSDVRDNVSEGVTNYFNQTEKILMLIENE